MARKARVYKKGLPGSEYDATHGTAKGKKDRAARNKLRKDLGLKKGDPKEAGHTGRRKKDGTLSNTGGKKQSFKSNRADQPKRGKSKK